MKSTFLLLLVLVAFQTAKAQSAMSQNYVVTTYNDTVFCDQIKLKALSVNCITPKGKKEILNENVRRIYMPVKDSDWKEFFAAYSASNSKEIYPYSPREVQAVVKRDMYPRFFDLKPIDAKKNFWARGLFEILIQNNGYKLCKLKGVDRGDTPLTAKPESNDKLVLFKENDANGVIISKANYRTELAKLVKGCSAAESALKDDKVNHLKDVPSFLTLFARCR